MTPGGVLDLLTYARTESSRLRESLDASVMVFVTSQYAALVPCRFTFAILLHCAAFLAHSESVLYASFVCPSLLIGVTASGESLGVSASFYALGCLLCPFRRANMQGYMRVGLAWERSQRRFSLTLAGAGRRERDEEWVSSSLAVRAFHLIFWCLLARPVGDSIFFSLVYLSSVCVSGGHEDG